VRGGARPGNLLKKQEFHPSGEDHQDLCYPGKGPSRNGYRASPLARNPPLAKSTIVSTSLVSNIDEAAPSRSKMPGDMDVHRLKLTKSAG